MNARLSPREIDAVRAHCGARRVLFLGDESPDAKHHAERVQATRLSLGRWGTISVSAMDERCVPEPVEGKPARDVAALLYTTGTTGEPKGVMLTHANLLFIARVSAELRGLTPDDRVFGLLPISHVYGLASVCLGTLRAGASLHLQARFTPAAMAECLVEQGDHRLPGRARDVREAPRAPEGARHALRRAVAALPRTRAARRCRPR